MSFYFGTHVSVSKGLVKAAEKVYKSGGNMVQIFLTSPKHRKVSKKAEPELYKFKKYIDKHNMKVVVHSSYLINLARDWDHHSWWLKSLELEMDYASRIGSIGVVVHFGKRLELTQEEAYNNMYTSILYVLDKTKKYNNIKLILETAAGQGTELCYKMEDLAYFYHKFTKLSNKNIKNRIKLCIDTCHIFTAGYDIRTKSKIEIFLEMFEEMIGFNHVILIHLNDCNSELGNRVDRHENIGKGKIKYKGLKFIFDYFKKLKKYIVLETPNEGYKTEIKKLNS